MAKSTQNYKLFEIMKSGETFSKEKIASILGVKEISVPVYIHELKSQYKAKIISVREGRKVVGYKLNVEESNNIKVPQFRKNSIQLQTPKKTVDANNTVVVCTENSAVPILDPDAELTKITERDFEDIKIDLGIPDMGHSFD